MGNFFSEHIGDIIVGGILLAVVVSIILKMIRDKKAGRSSCGCGGGCSGCSGSSIRHMNAEQIKKEITK